MKRKAVCFRAADHVIALETDRDDLFRYYQWKTRLLSADESSADIRVCIAINKLPQGIPYKAVNTNECVDDLHTSLWKNDSDGGFCILVPEESLHRMMDKSSMLAHHLLSILAEHGTVLLHSCGLAYGDKGILIAGYPGIGKSTLAVSWMQRGNGYLSDDTVWLSNGTMFPVESTIHPEKNKPGLPLGKGHTFDLDAGSDHKAHLDLTGSESQFVRIIPVRMLIALRRGNREEPEIQADMPLEYISHALVSTMKVMNVSRDYLGQFRTETAKLKSLPSYALILGKDTYRNAEKLENLLKEGDRDV